MMKIPSMVEGIFLLVRKSLQLLRHAYVVSLQWARFTFCDVKICAIWQDHCSIRYGGAPLYKKYGNHKESYQMKIFRYLFRCIRWLSKCVVPLVPLILCTLIGTSSEEIDNASNTGTGHEAVTAMITSSSLPTTILSQDCVALDLNDIVNLRALPVDLRHLFTDMAKRLSVTIFITVEDKFEIRFFFRRSHHRCR